MYIYISFHSDTHKQYLFVHLHKNKCTKTYTHIQKSTVFENGVNVLREVLRFIAQGEPVDVQTESLVEQWLPYDPPYLGGIRFLSGS